MVKNKNSITIAYSKTRINGTRTPVKLIHLIKKSLSHMDGTTNFRYNLGYLIILIFKRCDLNSFLLHIH